MRNKFEPKQVAVAQCDMHQVKKDTAYLVFEVDVFFDAGSERDESEYIKVLADDFSFRWYPSSNFERGDK